MRFPNSLVLSILCVSLSGCQATVTQLQKSVEHYTANMTSEDTGKLIGKVLGGVAAYKWSEDDKILWVSAGVLVGDFVGGQIGKYLDDVDQHKMRNSTGETIATGEVRSWENSEAKTKGTTKVVGEEVVTEKQAIRVLKKKVSKVPPLNMIGQVYKATSNVNVRGGPGEEYEKVSSLPIRTAVTVVGQVKGEDWFLVSQNGVGSGFVKKDYFVAAPGTQITPHEDNALNRDVEEHQVATTRTCRTIEQSVTLANGSVKKDRVEACQGADGWESKTS